MADILRSNFVVTVRAATLLVAMDSAGTALLTKQRRKILRSEQKCYGRLLSKNPKISREAGIPERRQELRLATLLTPVR